MAKIQVLGAGCRRCGQLAANAEQAATKFGRIDQVEKITDVVRFRDFAILALPALAIDGRVVWMGGAPSPEQICKFLEQREGNSEGNVTNNVSANRAGILTVDATACM